VEDGIPFEIKDTGITITPFSGKLLALPHHAWPISQTYTVHHGRLFTADPPPPFIPTPNDTPRTASPIPTLPDVAGQSARRIHPYVCWGFKIDEAVVYLSDVSHIPDDTWPVLESSRGTLPVLVLDCLDIASHISHIGLVDAISTARRVAARRTYLTGFGHAVSHDEYVTLGEVLGGKAIADTTGLTAAEQEGVASIEEGENVWLRPAHDGLRVLISEMGDVRDESYD
jgi:hypothetical protein